MVKDYFVQNIFSDFFSNIDLDNKNVLELGFSQCHFLRIMKNKKANPYGIYYDENVKTLGKTFRIEIDINHYINSKFLNQNK